MHSDAQALADILDESVEDANSWIDQAIAEQEREGFSVWPMVRKDTGALIGRCGLHRMENGEVEVAWMLARDAWGNGFATEAGSAAIDFGKKVLHLGEICALVDPLDSASVAVVNRLNMRFDRLVRAHRRDLLKYLT